MNQKEGVLMAVNNEKDIVFETCKLIIRHYRNLIEYNPQPPYHGFNTRLFSHMLHPEARFVHLGQSDKVGPETPTHPEHVVPCAVLNTESQRLILENKLSDDEIASLLQKHWKVATITKKEAEYLDGELKLKSVMPEGWDFESGDTLARLRTAKINLVPS